MKKYYYLIKISVICYILGMYHNTYSITNMLSMCTACHGEKGISNNPEWPNLAGQHESYLLKQLHDFQQGKSRMSPMMTPILATLTETDLKELATYYAKQKLEQHNGDKTKSNERGKSLYLYGDHNLNIPACTTCHGPTGVGNAEAGFPKISGQNIAYTVQQLQNFKSHKRTNDLNSIMQTISSRMTQSDMEAIAKYIQDLYDR